MRLDVSGRTVADFGVVSVDEFVESVTLREMFVKEVKEKSTYVGHHCGVPGRVEVNNPSSSLPFGWARRIICEVRIGVPTLLQGVLIEGSFLFKNLFGASSRVYKVSENHLVNFSF